MSECIFYTITILTQNISYILSCLVLLYRVIFGKGCWKPAHFENRKAIKVQTRFYQTGNWTKTAKVSIQSCHPWKSNITFWNCLKKMKNYDFVWEYERRQDYYQKKIQISGSAKQPDRTCTIVTHYTTDFMAKQPMLRFLENKSATYLACGETSLQASKIG